MAWPSSSLKSIVFGAAGAAGSVGADAGAQGGKRNFSHTGLAATRTLEFAEAGDYVLDVAVGEYERVRGIGCES